MDFDDPDHPYFSLQFEDKEVSEFYEGFDFKTEWKTSRGEIFLISEMTCQHIENTIRSLYKQNLKDKRLPSIVALHEERLRRLEGNVWLPGRAIGKGTDDYFDDFKDFFGRSKERNSNMILWLDEIKI